ncbi:MAG TPA: cellulase family glycosylhydrolase [Gaiella sp.]|uniref:cellulase family glycosylhydrolase n=1 Tax=Gaiella sp. TaxID=2663207 RepID=UPI002D8056F9|nr:cellulase family glycosylhydrolase [Gaiella sp.]HET9286663.1 cellulase family glycosylhydrolase [Gaiella sp.]
MRSIPRLLFLASLAAALLVPAATAADRMWVGFHDDPMLRWDDTRVDAMDRARGNEASILRTIVEWPKVAPTRPARASDPFDPAYQFGDVDEFIRNAQQRGLEVLITLWGTPQWANGGQKPQAMPRRLADFQNFARAVATRYSGRFAGYPFVRFYTIWNESNLATFLVPQFDNKGRIVSPRNYAKLAKAGIAGIKAGNKRALVAIGETSSNGRDKQRPRLTDTVAPATFMKGVAAAWGKVRFDAWAQHPYPFPVNQKPTQLVRYPNVTLKSFPRFEKDLDAAFKRKNIPIWITEYGNETRPGEPKGVTEAQQAAYIPQALAMARKDARVGMFIWFVMQDSQGSLWQSGIYRNDGSAKRAQPRFGRAARPLSPIDGKVNVRGGSRNPKITVYLREYCANNPVGTVVGYTVRAFQGRRLMTVRQGTAALGTDCTIPVRVTGLRVAKKKSYRVTVDANTATTASIVRTLTVAGA